MEAGRAALLRRVEEARAALARSAQRVVAMRAEVDFLCDHLSSAASIMAEIEAIEREMFDADGALSITSQETAGLIFEVQSVEEAVEEAEGELERLSSILIEGKGGQQRGH